MTFDEWWEDNARYTADVLFPPKERNCKKRLANKAWQAAQPQWQPIETAPKNQNILLGLFNNHNKWRTMRGSWFSKEEIDEYWENPEDFEAGWYEVSVEADDTPNCWPTAPSHWMPLPEPPTKEI